jgi:hypothetical protein|tara:strand:- start:19514 stop:22327 length:2814 start_codon:yes stop_codon:yes gene_type:complete
MSVEGKLSSLVENQFPAFYKEEGPKFLAFIKAYYQYLETTGKQQDTQRNLKNYKDIDDTLDEFIKYFRSELMPEIPNDALADKRLLAKRIKDLYTTKGTIDSYKLLFRILYNEDVEVNFPADQMLKVSDGDFRIDRYLTTHHDPRVYSFIGKTIKGTDSQAEALVEDVKRLVAKNRDIDQIILSNVKGSFTHLEAVQIKDLSGSSSYSPIVECGIRKVTITTGGGEYRKGDIVDIISSKTGAFAKAVVVDTNDLQSKVNFNIVDGGSGYITTEENQGTIVEYIGGVGTSPATFKILAGDITDTFALSLNTNKFASNSVFGVTAPRVTYRDTSLGIMNTHANTLLSSPDFGFREASETLVSGTNYRTNANAVIVLASGSNPGVVVGDSLFGVTSSANAIVKAIRRAYNSTNVVLAVDTFKNFQASETVKKTTATGATVGTVASGGFFANTIGYHVVQVANTDGGGGITQGDEIVGMVSGAFGVVKKVLDITASNQYDHSGNGSADRKIITMQVTANTTSNTTSQFDAGPMKAFIAKEGIRKVNSEVVVGNNVVQTSNNQIENIHTTLNDSLLFVNSTVGTIARLSNRIGGQNFTKAPRVVVEHRNVAALGIGEAYLTVQYDNANFGTGVNSIIALDTNDRLEQVSTGAKANIMAVGQTIQHANNTFETVLRVWQDDLQREPGGINWATGTSATKHFTDASQGSLAGTGAINIVSIQDEGILGENATISADIGANGSIKTAKVIDSGFSYKPKETVTFSSSGRVNAIQAQGTITIDNIANAEGYYASTRGHVSSARGFIQDSNFYQEFSYEIAASIALTRYKDVALRLVHPAGQKFFGKFKVSTNAMSQSVATSLVRKRKVATGTIAITNNANTVTGTGTQFTTEFANGQSIIIGPISNVFYQARLNIVSSATSANLAVNWTHGNITGANAHYFSGTVS